MTSLLCALSAGCTVKAQTSFNTAPPEAPTAPRAPRSKPSDNAPSAASTVPSRPGETAADPEAQRVFLANLGKPSAPAGRALKAPRVTALALENTARGEAPGMSPDGDLMVAQLSEGERITIPVQIEPGACFTAIAHGGLGVVEIDLFLTRGAEPSFAVLAEDSLTGPIAVVGGRPTCFENRERGAIEAQLHASVRRGAGVVLVQAYKR